MGDAIIVSKSDDRIAKSREHYIAQVLKESVSVAAERDALENAKRRLREAIERIEELESSVSPC